MSLKRIGAQARTVIQKPALQALLHQCCAFILTNLALVYTELGFGVALGMVAAALFQGVLAAFLSYWCGLAVWWLLMQLAFPLALVLLLAVQLPPVLFLILFLFLLVLYWGTYRTQVPYYPSNFPVWQAVAKVLPQNQSIKFIDVGSGLGGLVFYLAALRKESAFLGVELAPLPWLVSKLRSYGKGRGQFMHGDYMNLSFAEFDVVFAYLSPAAMDALWEKAHTEMRAGSLLLSYEFAIVGQAADFIIMPAKQGPALYGWRM